MSKFGKNMENLAYFWANLQNLKKMPIFWVKLSKFGKNYQFSKFFDQKCQNSDKPKFDNINFL